MRRAAVALLACCSYGCATFRAPTGSLSEPVVLSERPIASPQVEVWLEGDEPVTPAQLDEAREKVRVAVEQAFADGTLEPGAAGADAPLLVIRVRAVARTPGRVGEQRAAVAGIVIGFVVIVAAVVLLVILNKDAPKKAPRPGTAAPGRAGGGGRASTVRVPVASSVRPGPSSLPLAGRLPRGYPRGGWSGPRSDVHVGVGFVWVFPSPEPAPALAPGPEGAFAGDVEPGGAPGTPPALLAAPEPPGPPPELPAEPGEPPPDPGPAVAEFDLAALPPFDPEQRGFFDKEATLLALDLVDRHTGRLLWSKVERAEIDPRDPQAIRALVDRALANEPWFRRGAAPVPVPPAPPPAVAPPAPSS